MRISTGSTNTVGSGRTSRARKSLRALFILLFSLAIAGSAFAAARLAESGEDQDSGGFDGRRAFAHVKKMVEIGPRPSGSKELGKTREYIVGELEAYGLKIVVDEFRVKSPIGERAMVNITAVLPGQSTDVAIIASHYDTKRYEDFRFVGANDGGSSTGLLLELARAAAARQKPLLTYWFVFFDGEEAFCREWDDCGRPGNPDNTYGSRRYVAQLRKRDELKRVRAMILLDMIGYEKLELGRESLSTGWLVDTIWETARRLGHHAQFVDRQEAVGGDDHVPFLQAGVEAVNIIQLNTYPHWHTPDDTLEKISPRSLQIVGDVVLASLPRIEQQLKKKNWKKGGRP